MNGVIILALVGILLVDIVCGRVCPRDDRGLDAEMRRRNLLRELRRHD